MAWLLSVGVNRIPSFPFIALGLFLIVDGLLLIRIASKQQTELLELRKSLLEDDSQLAVSADEFMSHRSALVSAGRF